MLVSSRKPLIFAALVLAVTLLPVHAQAQDIRYVEPDEEAGTSQATVVGDVPLAHTDQLMALDERGELVGAGDARRQAERVLENVGRALEEAGAGLEDVMKLNVYAATTEASDAVRSALADRFTGEAKPAVSYVVTDLPREGALVAMDAVGVASPEHDERVVYRAEELGDAPGEQGHVAVMPPGGKVYVSGQVAQGKPVEAMRTSLHSMHDRLAYLGLSASDVVQVKVFLNDITDAAELEEEIAKYYRRKPAPPIVMVEWTHPGSDVEVEMIAARGQAEDVPGSEEAVSYPLPPNLRTFPTYSRVAEIHHGDIMYVSGLYGDPSKDAEGQMRDIFEQLGSIIEKAGSDFGHLAKATYYLDNWDVKGPLWDIRKENYPPERPPTSSLIPVEGVGQDGALITIDMIGVVPE